jgi:TolB-like protein/DNA-binding winged helix-turn-helix (wHTH) protein
MIYAIGSCLVDTDRFEVRRGSESIAVEPQVFDLLVLLIENRDRIVTRDEIIERVWKGRIVSDAAISSRIKAARRAIGDDGKLQSVIRTIHRRGLRFVGEVTIGAASSPGGSSVAPGIADEGEPGGSPGLDINDIRAAAGSGASRQSAEGHVPDESVAGIDLSLPKKPSIVVLPFHALGADEDAHIISDGLALDIMTRLARTRWLFVISRGTAFKFRGPFQDARTISLKLGVRYVVQGNIHFSGKRIFRVRVALIDAVADCEAWADQIDGSLDDIFRIQEEIASEIAGAVETEIERSERQRALLAPPSSLDAWTAYHRAAWHMYQFTPQGYEEAGRLLGLAAKLDPNFARVFAGLSFVHWQRAFLEIGHDREGDIQRAFDYAHHALLLDTCEPQGYWALGRACLLRQDLDQAVEEIERSTKLNPNFAIGHYSIAFARLLKSDSPESELSVRQARRLSPYDLMSFAMLAVQALNATLLGRSDEGANLADRAVQQPNAHYHILAIAAFCNAAAGRNEVSQAYLARLRAAHPGYGITDYLRAFPYREPGTVEQVRSTFLRLGLEG